MPPSTPASLPAPSQCRAVVVGGGTMGADIAVVLLRASCQTTVVEPDTGRHAGILARVDENLAAAGAQQNAVRLALVAGLDDAHWQDVDLVIECIPEKLPPKQALFAELVKRAPAHAILASNSSSFPISAIGQGLPTRERMLGLHFFMPAHLVPLVEVVLSEAADPRLGDALAAFMRRCGMVPVLVRKDVPGFLANRLQHALGREAFALIQEGVASPEDVDAAVRFGFGFRYLAAGPLLQRDHAGLEVHCAAAATMYPTLSNATEPPPVLTERVQAGHYGMKAGQGFYRWDEASIAAERARYERLLRAGLALIAEELPRIDP
jgi:3-hydroxyacyl-CoA dehydrogenase